jgi:hypothetical protein
MAQEIRLQGTPFQVRVEAFNPGGELQGNGEKVVLSVVHAYIDLVYEDKLRLDSTELRAMLEKDVKEKWQEEFKERVLVLVEEEPMRVEIDLVKIYWLRSKAHKQLAVDEFSRMLQVRRLPFPEGEADETARAAVKEQWLERKERRGKRLLKV